MCAHAVGLCVLQEPLGGVVAHACEHGHERGEPSQRHRQNRDEAKPVVGSVVGQ